MFTLYRAKKKIGLTLVEVMVAVAIFGTVVAMVAHWFTTNSQYHKRLTEQNDADDHMRRALWKMHQDLKTGRTIVYPRIEHVESDYTKNFISDNKVVFRNFDGDIITYYHDKDKHEIIREIVYIPTEDAPANERKVIGDCIDLVVFTNRNELNNTLGIYLESGPSCVIDSVFMMNE